MYKYVNWQKNQQLIQEAIALQNAKNLAEHCRNMMIEMDSEEILNGGDADYLRTVLSGGKDFKGYDRYSDFEAICEFRDREYCHEFFFGENFNAHQLLTEFLKNA